MIGGFKRLVDVLKKHRKKQFRLVADYTPLQFIKTTLSLPHQKA